MERPVFVGAAGGLPPGLLPWDTLRQRLQEAEGAAQQRLVVAEVTAKGEGGGDGGGPNVPKATSKATATRPTKPKERRSAGPRKVPEGKEERKERNLRFEAAAAEPQGQRR